MSPAPRWGPMPPNIAPSPSPTEQQWRQAGSWVHSIGSLFWEETELTPESGCFPIERMLCEQLYLLPAPHCVLLIFLAVEIEKGSEVLPMLTMQKI